MGDISSLSVYPFILSGGSGTRLWPLSRVAYPKQFMKLVGDDSLLQQCFLRISKSGYQSASVLCNHEHRFLVAEQLQVLGVEGASIILEPVGRNTGPAALIAALTTLERNEDGLILLMPSDHVIEDDADFARSIGLGMSAAQAGQIVTFGIEASTPETGYGYIETRAGDDETINNVVRFVEKPDLETATQYVASGNFFWNAGIFLFSAKAMLAAFEAHHPDMVAHCRLSIKEAQSDLDFLRLDEGHYAKCENISLDYAVIEKTDAIKCVPLRSKWSDLGAWPAVWDAMDKDDKGNVSRGDVVLHDVQNSYAHSVDGACLAMVGVEDVMAIATKDAVMITSRNQAQDVKHIVSLLKANGRDEVLNHRRVYRPWGWYERLELGERFQVKCLMVKPGAKLSLQSHHHRAEHWVTVSGTVEVTRDDEVFLLSENESTYIPVGAVHRLANPGKLDALLIEVQSGSYLGEDDIVRYEDVYGRSDKL